MLEFSDIEIKKKGYDEKLGIHLSRYDPISFANGFKYSTANSKPTIGGYTGYTEDIGILAIVRLGEHCYQKVHLFYPRIFPRTTVDHVISNMDKGVSAAEQVMFPWVTLRDGVVEEKQHSCKSCFPFGMSSIFGTHWGQQRTPVHFVS